MAVSWIKSCGKSTRAAAHEDSKSRTCIGAYIVPSLLGTLETGNAASNKPVLVFTVNPKLVTAYGFFFMMPIFHFSRYLKIFLVNVGTKSTT